MDIMQQSACLVGRCIFKKNIVFFYSEILTDLGIILTLTLVARSNMHAHPAMAVIIQQG